jgi:uroporphyrin-3 C-methyltransferase
MDPGATDPGAMGNDPSATTADEENRWTELIDNIGQSLGRLVRVQKHDEHMTALLTPDDERLMRQNLQIKFETARLALLEGRGQIYQDTLEEAQRWLRTYFDTNDAAVDAALSQSAELLAVTVEPVLPDISGSLRQLRAARETLTQTAGARPGS